MWDKAVVRPMTMEGDLTGHRALVTGAGSGIGAATARELAAQGAHVLVVDLDEAAARRVADGIGQAATPWACDVRDGDEVEAMVAGAVDELGGVEIAVNNAGILGPLAPTGDYPEGAWDDVLDTNLKGLWRCLKAELGVMVPGGGGAIVNMASEAALTSFRGASAYTASKHGVLGVTRTAAVEYARHGVRVNAVCPGIIDTPMLHQGLPEGSGDEALIQATPMRRLGRPEEIAKTVSFLASEAASFITGHALVADGGLQVA